MLKCVWMNYVLFNIQLNMKKTLTSIYVKKVFQ